MVVYSQYNHMECRIASLVSSSYNTSIAEVRWILSKLSQAKGRVTPRTRHQVIAGSSTSKDKHRETTIHSQSAQSGAPSLYRLHLFGLREETRVNPPKTLEQPDHSTQNGPRVQHWTHRPSCCEVTLRPSQQISVGFLFKNCWAFVPFS